MTTDPLSKSETTSRRLEKVKDSLRKFAMPVQRVSVLNSILILSAATSIFLFVRLLFRDPSSGSVDLLFWATVLLSLWIVAASGLRLRQASAERSRLQVLVWLLQITLVLAVVFFAHPVLSWWATLFVPAATADSLLTPVWVFLVPVIGISLFLWRGDSWNGHWKAFLIGACGGTLLLYLWTPIVYLITYNLFVPDIKFYGDGFYELSQWALGLGAGILFLSGIASLQLAKPTSRKEAISLTSITGLTIALFLFTSPGSIFSGVASQASLYGVAFSRVGYDEAGWIDALVKAIIYVFPWLYGTLLACIGLGALPVLIGLIWPIRKKDFLSSPANQLSAYVPTVLTVLFLTITFLLALFVVLAQKIINTYEAAGTASWWDPEWIVPSVLALPAFVIALLLIRVLLQLPSSAPSYQNATILRTIGGVIFLGALGINFVHPVAPGIVLLLVGIGVELFFQAGRFAPTAAPADDRSDHVEPLEPVTSVLSMSAPISLLLALPLVVIPVVLALIPIVAIAELSKVTDPPPGRDWLLKMLETFVFTTPGISWVFITALFIMLFGVLYSLHKTQPKTLWNSSEKTIQKIANILRINTPGDAKRYIFVTLIVLITAYLIVFNSSTFSPLLLAALLLGILINAGHPSFRNSSMLVYGVAAAIVVLETIFLAYQRSLPTATFDSTIVLWPAFAVLYAGLISSSGNLSRSLGRILFLGAIGALATLMINFAKPVTLVENGVARLSSGRWQVLDFREGYLVSDRNYSLSSDKQGRLWFIGHFGPDAVEQNGEWRRLRSYSNVSDFLSDTEGRASRLESPGLFLDQDSTDWFTTESNIYMLVSTTNGYASYTPRQAVDVPVDPPQVIATCNSSYACPDLQEKNITAMLADSSRNVWVSTDGAGVIRFLADRPQDNADWTYFTTENSGIASNNITGMLNDSQGALWFLSSTSVSSLSSADVWATYSINDIGLDGSLKAIYQDSQYHIWVGSTNGISRWEMNSWIPSAEFHDSVNSFYEDQQGQLWALTSSGAYQYLDGKWLFFRDIPQDPLWQNPFRISSFYHLEPYATGITAMAEGLDGVLWFGGPHGLLKYDPRVKQAEAFYPSNSGLPAEHVRSLLVDRNNVLWVSTYTVNRAYRSEAPVIGFAALFMVLVLVTIYSQYQKSTPFKAKQISKRLASQPQTLLNEIYRSFAEPESDQLLASLTKHIEVNQGFRELIQAYSEINAAGNGASQQKANAIFRALGNNTILPESRALEPLYSYFSRALSALTVNAISHLPLQVLRAHDGQKITITDGQSIPYDLPDIVDVRLSDSLEMIGKSAALLRKYLQIDNTQDKLGFIADSLGAVERAKRDAQSITGPEQYFIREICDLWLSIIGRELDVLSGHADLQVEFRTRQVKRSDEVTLVLRIKNAGSAIANQVHVSLLPNAGIRLDSKTTRILEYIGAGSSENVEFSIKSPAAGDVRVVGEIMWSDRIEENNRSDFADVVRFYESTETFARIPNPYIVGHPVKSAELFQGREDIFEFISQNIHSTTQSRTLVLYGQRRTGKTSILYQLLNGRLGSDYIPILVDVQELAPGIQGMADLFLELALHLERALKKSGIKLEKINEASFAASPTRAFSRLLSDIEGELAGRKIVLMFDEFELLEERMLQGKLQPESLGYLRSLMQHKDDLVFLFTGTHKLEQMSKDYWSIFFNIALHQQVSFMSNEDAARLIREPVQGKLSIDDLVVDKIYSLTHGHPYFVQLLCWALVNYCNKEEKNYATVNDLNEVLKEIVSTGDAYFAYIWTQVTPHEKIIMSALAERLAPGKIAVSVEEILETMENAGVQAIDKATAIQLLDGLTDQEILASAGHGGLHYSYRVGLIGEWVKSAKSLRYLAEREQ